MEPLKGTPARLCHAAISTGTDTLYTAEPDGRTAFTDIMAANTTASPIRLTLGIGGIAAANQVLPNVSIDGYSVLTMRGYQILNVNETLQATASSDGITLTISGVERV